MIRPLALMILLAGSALAQPIRLVALDGALGEGIPSVVERLLGDDAIIKAVFIREAGANGDLVADVHLSGGSLSVPMMKNLRFRTSESPSHPALSEGIFAIAHPDTTKPITQIAVIYAVNDLGEKTLVASFELRWNPSDGCKVALNERSKGTSQLVVFGDVPGLREQLRSWHVAFTDAGSHAPDRIEAHTLAIGDIIRADAILPVVSKAASLFLVRMDAATEPSVFRHDEADRRITKVSLRKPADWRRSSFLVRQLTEHLTPIAP